MSLNEKKSTNTNGAYVLKVDQVIQTHDHNCLQPHAITEYKIHSMLW